MSNDFPKEFWVDRDVFFSGGICSHVAQKNEIEGGIKCYPAHLVDSDLLFGKLCFLGVIFNALITAMVVLIQWLQ